MSASLKLTEDGVLVASASNTATAGLSGKRHSGILAEALVVSAFDPDFASYLAVASRDKVVTVAIAYAVAADETYTVRPGRPLLILLSATEVPQLVSVTPESAGDRPDIELAVYASTVPLNPAEEPFLILNAGTGITEDEFLSGSVVSWRDTRASSLAPDEFEWSNLALAPPTLIASDPDFGGKPSVDFSAAGDAAFTYEILDDRFEFLCGNAGDLGTDFTVLTILSVPDDALTATQYQGLWCVLFDATDNGFSMLVDPAYRMYNSIPASSETTIYTDEFKEKPMVVIWDFDESTNTLRTYWQGRWHSAETFVGTIAGNPNVLRVGKAFTQAGLAGYLRGKIADFRVYNRRLSAAEKQAYIDMAVSEYGIVDTEVQGFPFLSSCRNFQRANRGVASATFLTWTDTRPEFTTGANVWTSGMFQPTQTTPTLLNGQDALSFDGSTTLAVNPFTGTAGDHLGGASPGFTIGITFYREVIGTSGHALLAMGNYLAGTLDGTTFFWSPNGRELNYETDNGVGANVIYDAGEIRLALTPIMAVLRTDGTSYWIDEIDLSTGETSTTTGATAGTPSATTAATMYMSAFPDSTGYSKVQIAEQFTVASSITDAQLTELFAYALARYGT